MASIPLTLAESLAALAKPRRIVKNAKLLKIAVVGAPNHGKSSLINALIRRQLAGVSKRPHTTDRFFKTVLTVEDTQLIFTDTPGAIDLQRRKKHNLGRAFLMSSYEAFKENDLVLVVADSVFSQFGIDKAMLSCLNLQKHADAALVLTKVDLVKNKSLLLSNARLLTKGVVDSRPYGQLPTDDDPIKQLSPEIQVLASKETDTILLRLQKLQELAEQSEDEFDPERPEDLSNTIGAKQVSQRIQDIFNESRKRWIMSRAKKQSSPADVPEKTNSRPSAQQLRKLRLASVSKDKGWPHFKHVFMVNSMDGDGINEVMSYLLSKAKPGEWLYPDDVVIEEDARLIASDILRSQMLDRLPQEVPFKIEIQITDWVTPNESEDGALHVVVKLVCFNTRQYNTLLANNGLTLLEISDAAETIMVDAFQQDVSLKLLPTLRKDNTR